MVSKSQPKFTIRIENISTGNMLKLAFGGDAPFALSPILCLMDTHDAPEMHSA
jgi:hypothetical protein